MTTMKRSDHHAVRVRPVRVITNKRKKKTTTEDMNVRLRRSVSISWSLQKLFDCCRRVFHGRRSVPRPDDVRRLCGILDAMKAEDVGLSRDLQFFKPDKLQIGNEECPKVTSASIYKCKYFELCIFFLPANAVIPLHNHPNMTVFSKLLLGSMHMKSYDWVDPDPIHLTLNSSRLRLAKLKADTALTAPCNASVLYPTTGGNIHEFTAITPCAMLDVLGPPYSKDDGHDCSYYKDHPYETLSLFEKEEIRAKVEEDGEGGYYGLLEETKIPKELEMEAIEYMGPKLLID